MKFGGRAKKVRAVYIAGLASHIAVFLRQTKEMDVRFDVLSFRTGEDPILIESAGELAEGVVFTSGFDAQSEDSVTRAFVDDFRVAYDSEPDNYAAEGYAGMMLLGEAFAKCVKDYSCIQAYLTNLKDHQTVLGKVTMDQNGDITYPFFLKTVRDGKFVRLFGE